MPSDFHQYFFEQLKQTVTPNQVLAQEMVNLLHKSKANIYKKVSGEVPFSAEEIIVLARHFGISLDQFIHNGQGDFDKISVDYSLPQHQPRSPLLFMEKIRRDMEQIAQLPLPFMRYASNEVPIFHSLLCRNLLAFKLYVWARTNWKLPEMRSAPFQPDEFYERWPEIEEHRQVTYQLYQKTPSIEYWPRPIISNILNQIRYYSSVNMFQDPKMPRLLLKELEEMIDSRAVLAANGNKGRLPDGQNAASFGLYLNEIAFTNNLVLVYNNEKPIALYATMDNPNFVRSTHQGFCQRMHQWATQIEECSFLLTNEQHRMSLFSDLKQQIQAAVLETAGMD